jgi:hypothetical protein
MIHVLEIGGGIVVGLVIAGVLVRSSVAAAVMKGLGW